MTNTAKSSGRTAEILTNARKALADAARCPCGRRVLNFLRENKDRLKGLQIKLCKKGFCKPWLQLLLSSGIIELTPNCGKRSVTIVLETPVAMALAALEKVES